MFWVRYWDGGQVIYTLHAYIPTMVQTMLPRGEKLELLTTHAAFVPVPKITPTSVRLSSYLGSMHKNNVPHWAAFLLSFWLHSDKDIIQANVLQGISFSWNYCFIANVIVLLTNGPHEHITIQWWQ